MQSATVIGQGLYTFPEAARIIGTSTQKLRRWIRDSEHKPDGSVRRNESVIYRSDIDPDLLTFVELVELLFVEMFRSQGVSMRTIRRASANASKMFGSHYPFTVKGFATDGRRVFATLAQASDAPDLIADIERGQLAFDKVVRPFFRNLAYDADDNLVRLWPLGEKGRVVIDPARQFGQPIDAETGVPTAVLAQAVEQEGAGSEQRVADWYAVPLAAVVAAIDYESSPAIAA